MATKAPAAKALKKDEWIIKDRLYELTRGKKPLVFTVPTTHSTKKALYCGLMKECWVSKRIKIRYQSKKSCFVDEQARTSYIRSELYSEMVY